MTTRFVDIRQARVSLEVQEGQTILDAALAAGIPYPHGCRSGRTAGLGCTAAAGHPRKTPGTATPFQEETFP